MLSYAPSVKPGASVSGPPPHPQPLSPSGERGHYSGLGTQHFFVDHVDPVLTFQAAVGECSDDFEDLVREASDVQDVFAVCGLRGRVRLDVDADHLRLRVAGLELR